MNTEISEKIIPKFVNIGPLDVQSGIRRRIINLKSVQEVVIAVQETSTGGIRPTVMLKLSKIQTRQWARCIKLYEKNLHIYLYTIIHVRELLHADLP